MNNRKSIRIAAGMVTLALAGCLGFALVGCTQSGSSSTSKSSTVASSASTAVSSSAASSPATPSTSAAASTANSASTSTTAEQPVVGTAAFGTVPNTIAQDESTLVATYPSKFTQVEYKDAETGLTVTYNLFLPEGYDASQSYPMVVFIADSSCAKGNAE